MKANLLIFSILALLLTEIQSKLAAAQKTNEPAINIKKVDVNDKILQIAYEIINNSNNDIWILDYIGNGSFEAYLGDDGQTLIISRRLDVPSDKSFYAQPDGLYHRLPAGQSRLESLLLNVPVERFAIFTDKGEKESIVIAKRLVLEIGFYDLDLPKLIYDLLDKAEKVNVNNNDYNLEQIKKQFGGILYFNQDNEFLGKRDEYVRVVYSWQAFRGELILKTEIENLEIPYNGVIGSDSENINNPDISSSTRIEVNFLPSMFEYFFPLHSQQNLLSNEETKYLQSEKTLIIEDLNDISSLAEEIKEGKNVVDGFVCEDSKANVICYKNNNPLSSFVLYNDKSIDVDANQRLVYLNRINSLRKITPQIKPLESRINCAENLKNLWYRLHLYQKASKSVRIGLLKKRIDSPYPDAKNWCDYIMRAYENIGMKNLYVIKPFKCPSAGKGKCHYAINPNCKPDSPGDMVLLFETKNGWNQHGGPELFTFDNHDPKGGCVLFNDGTVKFIRTEEELKNLRWK
jgi:hypothetical protein